jgi:hypothetical protein
MDLPSITETSLSNGYIHLELLTVYLILPEAFRPDSSVGVFCYCWIVKFFFSKLNIVGKSDRIGN